MSLNFKRNARETVLIDGISIAATGVPAIDGRTGETSFFPPYILNPRFQLLVENYVAGGGGGLIKITIEHSEIPNTWSPLFVEFVVNANGVYEAYSENLTTTRPFSRVRARVTDLDSGASCTATLVGLCDKQ